ncbi:MAG: hypothetical protein AAB340_00265 [Patescibacteria group bacterium]
MRQAIKEIKGKKYWEARQNLFAFFSLLIQVDKRINPNLYHNVSKPRRFKKNSTNPYKKCKNPVEQKRLERSRIFNGACS